MLLGTPDARSAARRHASGASLVAWTVDAAEALDRAGIPHHRAAGLLGADGPDRIDEAAIAWTKDWGSRPMMDGRAFRELHHWHGVSLWWFAELYLHHSTRSPRWVRAIETFHRILDGTTPEEVDAVGLTPEETVLLARTCTARGILFHGGHRPSPTLRLALRWRERRASLEARGNAVMALASALKAVLAGAPPEPPEEPGRRRILFLSHAAFWRARRDPDTGTTVRYEHYFDRLIPEAADDPAVRPLVIGVGPRAAFRRRGLRARVGEWTRFTPGDAPYVHVNRFGGFGVFRALRHANREMRRAWRALRGSPGVREAFSHRGVAFADLAAPDLAATLLLQVPWAVRCYEEMAAALDHLRPDVVCLYAESSGWGRAAVAACQSRGIPSVGVQHGILYPRYYSYLHRSDEGDCPRPDRTAVFGEAARRFLVEEGRYPPGALVVTGSPKFDDLVRAAASWDRETLRRAEGVADGERLVVVASRYRGIRETHQSIGSAFPALVAAVESLEAVRCVVKPHPAEAEADYAADVRGGGATRVRVAPPGTDLMPLLHAADVLVTVESLAAVEALVLGRPVVVLNMPTNLRALVDASVAVGVAVGDDPLPAMRQLLFDPSAAERLAAARRLYLSDVAAGVDGRATARILSLLKDMAGATAASAGASAAGAGHGRV